MTATWATPSSSTGTSQAPARLAGRLMSLDLFRGATIAMMILVNNPGDEQTAYWPLKHAQWNGWTPTDLVFPSFLFIVGVSMTYSFASRLKRESRHSLMMHVLRRGAILFALGLFLNAFPNRFHLDSWRVYGVLQRIAICYVVSALVALWSSRRGQVLTIIGCLVSYWVLMRFVPVPGFGVPTHDMPFLDPNRNLAAWLDRKLLMGHLYDVTRDPEGVISTIPAIATSLLGVLTGGWIRSERSPQAKALGLIGFGVAGLTAGKVLDAWFPINKNLWTPSFVVFTAGFAMVALGICYWILDIRQWRGWAKPFLVFGVNPIAAYVFAEMMAHWIDRMTVQLADGFTLTWQEKIYQHLFVPLASPPNASLLYALSYVLMCWVAMWVLERRGIYLKI